MGTFLRPKELLSAREKCQNDEIGKDELRAIEDKFIVDLVKKQKANGFRAITDGDFRRAHWFVDFLCGLEGVSMHYETSPDGFDAPVLEVVGFYPCEAFIDLGNWGCRRALASVDMNSSKIWAFRRRKSASPLRLSYTLAPQKLLRSQKLRIPKVTPTAPHSSKTSQHVTERKSALCTKPDVVTFNWTKPPLH